VWYLKASAQKPGTPGFQSPLAGWDILSKVTASSSLSSSSRESEQ
jgi:hypothetical protein